MSRISVMANLPHRGSLVSLQRRCSGSLLQGRRSERKWREGRNGGESAADCQDKPRVPVRLCSSMRLPPPHLSPELSLPAGAVGPVLGPLAGLFEGDLVDLLLGQVSGQGGNGGIAEEVHHGEPGEEGREAAVDLDDQQ